MYVHLVLRLKFIIWKNLRSLVYCSLVAFTKVQDYVIEEEFKHFKDLLVFF
jgi:hypothetical protein